MPHAHLNDIDLYYEVHGPAVPHTGLPPLVMLAGLATDSQSWLPVLPDLAARRAVVILDNRGCGRTTPQDAPNSLARMAADCLALADRLGLPRFDLLGHSMGGCIALECALARPERINRLVLANSAATNSARNDLLFADWAAELEALAARGADLTRWFRTFFYWIFTPALFADPAMLADWLRLSVTYPWPQSAAGFRGQVAAMRGFDRRADLPRIDRRTLILAGGADLLFPPDGAGLTALPQARQQIIPDQAHGLYIQAPAAFVGAVGAFLS